MMMVDSETPLMMGLSEYARHRGCWPSAVEKAEKSGRIAAAVRRTEAGEFIGIDWRLADQLWAANTDPMEAAKNGKEYTLAYSAGRIVTEAEIAADVQPDGPEVKPAAEVGVSPRVDDQHGYLAARGLREQYQAERARLDLMERLGEVLGRDDVRDKTFAAFRRLRDNLLLIGPRVSMTLAAETDPLRIERVIADEHRKLLNELARALAVDAAAGAAVGASATV